MSHCSTTCNFFTAKGIAEYFGDHLSDEEVKVMQQAPKKILGAIAIHQ
ncbi:hypothetical protein QUB80_12110 [Chlorogloeopsis sp. ULAP01]|nr:hypothetical protein [Chlorogloeopsis sp. ULAP01]MDM9381445.1 hypothetical protein [Chlorogloeopsis sp. ULAP01]